MTIRYPKDSFLNKILKYFGKERKIILPDNLQELNDKYGPYSNISLKKENLWEVLFAFKKEK